MHDIPVALLKRNKKLGITYISMKFIVVIVNSLFPNFKLEESDETK